MRVQLISKWYPCELCTIKSLEVEEIVQLAFSWYSVGIQIAFKLTSDFIKFTQVQRVFKWTPLDTQLGVKWYELEYRYSYK